MKRLTVFSLAAALVLLVSGCASLGDLGNVVRKPTAEVTKAAIEELSFSGAQIGIDVKVSNPNPVGLSLAGFSYTLFVNSEQFITGDFKQGISIAARGSSTVHVPVSFEYQKLISGISSLADRNETPYRVDLKLSFDVPVLGKVVVPVSAQGTLPVVRVPVPRVAALQLRQLTLSGASVVLRVALSNPNAFALTLARLDYSFSVNGRRWAQAAVDHPATVAAGTASEIEIPISLDFGSVGRSVIDLLTGGAAVDYSLTGGMKIGTALPLLPEASLPVDLSGRIGVTR